MRLVAQSARCCCLQLIHSVLATAAGNPHNSQLASIGSGTMLQMMLVDNLIHSDLHPGNILVRLEPPAGLLGGCMPAGWVHACWLSACLLGGCMPGG